MPLALASCAMHPLHQRNSAFHSPLQVMGVSGDPWGTQADIARIARRDTPADRLEQHIAGFRTEERVTIRMTIDHTHARGI